MKQRNPIAKHIRTPQYKSRVVPNKKKNHDPTYDWVDDMYEDRNAQTEQDTSPDEELQSEPTSD